MRPWLVAAIAMAAGAARVEARPAANLFARTEGRNLTVGWTSAPKATSEWEAFLSFDGGKSISLRVTPHLPAATREFTFELPHLAPTDATVVFRFGEAGVEREYLAPGAIRVAADRPAPLLTGRASDTGATAAPGEESSVGWAESEDVTVVPPLASGIAPATRLVLPASRLSFTRSAQSKLAADRTSRPAPLESAGRAKAVRPAISADVLLLTTRLNV